MPPTRVPLVDINELGPGLRVDEIVGSEVRSSDDKIVGEVRNVGHRTKDRWDYAVVASGGFFISGKDSIVVPLRYLQVDGSSTLSTWRISRRRRQSRPANARPGLSLASR